ncbi:MAG: CarD family transcriptional regulator [Oscillospiraceae bacterium]
MFEINAKVSHPEYGACKIIDICELNLTGKAMQYYRLEPYNSISDTVYIPVETAEKIGLRHLISKKQALTLLNSLPDAEEEWSSDFSAKQKRYRTIFADNSVESLQETFSAMSAIIKWKNQKELRIKDKIMLENIQKKVMPELALVLDMTVSDVIHQAEKLILQAQ